MLMAKLSSRWIQITTKSNHFWWNKTKTRYSGKIISFSGLLNSQAVHAQFIFLLLEFPTWRCFIHTYKHWLAAWHPDEHCNTQWTPWLMEPSFKNDTDMKNHLWLSSMTSIALHRKLESYELAMSFRRNDLKITPSIQCSPPHYDSVPWLQREGIKKGRKRQKRKSQPCSKKKYILTALFDLWFFTHPESLWGEKGQLGQHLASVMSIETAEYPLST